MGYLSRIAYLEQLELSEQSTYFAKLASESAPLIQLDYLYCEHKLQTAILRFLQMQKKFLETLPPHQSNNFSSFLMEYHGGLAQIVADETSKHLNYLKTRNKAKSSQLLEQIGKQLSLLSEEYLLTDEILNLSNRNELMVEIEMQLHAIEKEYQKISDAMEQAKKNQKQITRYWQAYLEREKARLNQVRQQDLLALCESGDIVGVKAWVQRCPLGRRRKSINTIQKALRDEAVILKTSALHLACLYGHPNLVALLLEQGADPTIPDEEGYLVIHQAVLNISHSRGPAVLDVLLLKYRELIHGLGPYSRTPLHTAAFFGHLEAAQCLLIYGAAINARESEGLQMTPLHCAVYQNHIEIVGFLIAKKADLSIKNANGETPLQQALYNCQRELIACFIQWGYCFSVVELDQLEQAIQLKRCSPQALQLLGEMLIGQVSILEQMLENNSPILAGSLSVQLTQIFHADNVYQEPLAHIGEPPEMKAILPGPLVMPQAFFQLSRITYLEQLSLPRRRKHFLKLDLEATSLATRLDALYYERKFQEVKLRFLEVQKKFLENLKSQSFDNLITHYHGELSKVVSEEVITYGDYLDARTYTEVVMPLEEMRNRLTELASEYLLEAEFLANNDCQKLLNEVNLQFESANNEYQTTFDVMTAINSDYQEININWEAYLVREKAKLEQIYQRDLLALCEAGDIDGVKAWLRRCPLGRRSEYINKRMKVVKHETVILGTTGLHLACLYGHSKLVAFLLSQGADPRLPDEEGYLAIHQAVSKVDNLNCSAVLSVLLSKQRDLIEGRGPYGRTALHTAAFFGHLTAVKCLLQWEASIDGQETGGLKMTPLHCAVYRNHTHVIEFLVAKKANLYIENANGETPLQQALYNCQQPVVECFVRLGYSLTAAQLRKLERDVQSKRCSPEAIKLLSEIFIKRIGLIQKILIQSDAPLVAQLEAQVNNLFQPQISSFKSELEAELEAELPNNIALCPKR